MKFRTYMWSRPYPNKDEVISIITGLSTQWRYSPKFKHPIVEAQVLITGRRSKDYKLAEEACGVSHVPGKTVWHHVWEENRGLYTMQLVEADSHMKTCPHAGGCKLWSLKHNNKRYASTRASEQEFVLDFIFEDKADINNKPRAIYQYRKKKRSRLYGMDPYGNIFVTGRNGKLYLYDHEEKVFEFVNKLIDNTGKINS